MSLPHTFSDLHVIIKLKQVGLHVLLNMIVFTNAKIVIRNRKSNIASSASWEHQTTHFEDSILNSKHWGPVSYELGDRIVYNLTVQRFCEMI